MSLNKILEEKSKIACKNHWYTYKGLNLLDLYDVTRKLTIIHDVAANWSVMPFLGDDSFPRLFKNAFDNWVASNKAFLAIPAGTKKHWTYILIDRKTRLIEHWDSRGNSAAFLGPETRRRLSVILYLMRRVDSRYQVVNRVNIVHQHNDTFCGLYSIRFLEERMKGIDSKVIVKNLSYDIDTFKSRYHWIRCADVEHMKENKWLYKIQRSGSRFQFEKLPWYSPSRLLSM